MCAVSVGTAGQYRPQSRLRCASSTERDQKKPSIAMGRTSMRTRMSASKIAVAAALLLIVFT
jgi:hypothetical protein